MKTFALALLIIACAAPIGATVPDIASAATITLHGSGIYRITGTATISTIAGVRDGDLFVLLPGGAFVLNAAGNISPITSTAVVGRPLYFCVANGTVYENGVATNAITNAQLRQSVATSVIGRSANSTGNVADIAASADGQFLARHAGALSFAALAAGDVPDAALSSNVPLKNAANTFTGAGQTLTPGSGTVALSVTAGQINSSSQFGASVSDSAGTSIPNNTLTAITFDSEAFDRGACHSTVSNTSRITVPTGGAGIWLITAVVGYPSGAGTLRVAEIRRNGVNLVAFVQIPPVSGSGTMVPIAAVYSLSDADYVELLAQQDSGGALTTATGTTFFSAVKLY
jgi:hypothetical protein